MSVVEEQAILPVLLLEQCCSSLNLESLEVQAVDRYERKDLQYPV
jgi:hypothetical protein